MKSLRFLIPLLLVLASCASDQWKTVRPLQECAIEQDLRANFFGSSKDIHVNSYIIPDAAETPEVRLVIVGRYNVNDKAKLDSLAKEVEAVVTKVAPFLSKIPRDTSRIRIQLTGYNADRKVMEYYNHEWKELSKNITDIELRTDAMNLQNKMAKQRGFE